MDEMNVYCAMEKEKDVESDVGLGTPKLCASVKGIVQCRIFIDNIIRLDLTELPKSIISLSKVI